MDTRQGQGTQTRNEQQPEGANVNLGERINADLTNGWNYFTVDAHKPLHNLRDIQDALQTTNEVIMRPPQALLNTLDSVR